jgi:putative ABC transport system permease protein
MRHGVSLIVTGVGLGLCGTVALRSILASQVFGISPLDPITIVVGVLAVVVVLLLACYLPARRAARIDPMTALRQE